MSIGVLLWPLALAACGSLRDHQGSARVSTQRGDEPGSGSHRSLASRSTGVAPLAVFFDVIDAPDVVLPAKANGRREYADFHYQWTFADPSSGQWAVSGASKNGATGHVAAHVFEEPGAYDVGLEVTDRQHQTQSYRARVTVLDPNSVYAGTRTVCISRSGDFNGCPNGAFRIRSETLEPVQDHLATGKRILLRRGERWELAASIMIERIDGPLTLGAFGPCETPDERTLCANAPVLHALGADLQAVIRLSRVRDVRIMDLAFTSDSNNGEAVGGSTDLREVLLLRLRAEGFDMALLSSHWKTLGHDQFMVVDSDVRGSARYPAYVGSERLVFMGNRLRDSLTTHVLRVWQGYKALIAHNEISGSSLQTSTGRHALKLHGPEEPLVGTDTPRSLARRTQHVIVADNLFGGSGPWPVCIEPQNKVKDERLRDVVVERNRFFAGFGNLSSKSSPVTVALRICARGVTVRNNVFSGAGSADSYRAIHVATCGITPVPRDIRILNNTVHKTDYATKQPQFIGVTIDETVSDVLIRNNLFHFPAGVGATMLQLRSQSVVHDHNLLVGEAAFVDAGNASLLHKDFSLPAGSPAVDAGAPAPVFDDLAGQKRPLGLGMDLGAFERRTR